MLPANEMIVTCPRCGDTMLCVSEMVTRRSSYYDYLVEEWRSLSITHDVRFERVFGQQYPDVLVYCLKGGST